VNEKIHQIIAGIDEAGRGCLAGPVVAASVILPPNYSLPGLRDSKKISSKKRYVLETQIKEVAISWGIGMATPKEIDVLNILRASLLAMERSFSRLSIKPDIVYVDGIYAPNLKDVEVVCVKKGDDKIPQISAASILAKTFRDRLMHEMDKKYPDYGFKNHKGYATRLHLERLKIMGPCKIHRKTFKGVKELFWDKSCLIEKAD